MVQNVPKTLDVYFLHWFIFIFLMLSPFFFNQYFKVLESLKDLWLQLQKIDLGLFRIIINKYYEIPKTR